MVNRISVPGDWRERFEVGRANWMNARWTDCRKEGLEWKVFPVWKQFLQWLNRILSVSNACDSRWPQSIKSQFINELSLEQERTDCGIVIGAPWDDYSRLRLFTNGKNQFSCSVILNRITQRSLVVSAQCSPFVTPFRFECASDCIFNTLFRYPLSMCLAATALDWNGSSESESSTISTTQIGTRHTFFRGIFITTSPNFRPVQE